MRILPRRPYPTWAVRYRTAAMTTGPVPLPLLPITEVLPAIDETLRRNTTLLVQAPPGAGKSTVVPLVLLAAPWLSGKKILMLEPRRLAARAVANRMAHTLDEPVGRTVGYRTRLDTKISRDTRIEVVTEGILTRMLQDNSELPDIACVIFDEFHERSLNADLGLALCLESQQSLREELRILVMSATLDLQPLAKLLGDAPIVTPPEDAASRSRPITSPAAPTSRLNCRWHRQCVRHCPRMTAMSSAFFPAPRRSAACSEIWKPRDSAPQCGYCLCTANWPAPRRMLPLLRHPPDSARSYSPPPSPRPA